MATDNKPTRSTAKSLRWLERAGFALVFLAMGCAMYFSGWGMWHVIEDKFDLAGRPEMIVPMFLLFDLAGIACAILALWSLLARSTRGAAYPLVWVFAALSGLMSATDGTNPTAQVTRFAAPLVAAGLFELLLSIKQHVQTGTESWVMRKFRPLLARLRLLDPEVSSSEAARRAAVGRLATLAYRMHQLGDGTWRRRKAQRKFLRNLRAAVERHQIASDDDMIQAVRAGVAVLHGAVAQTAPDALDDVNPWTRQTPAPVVPPVPPVTPPVTPDPILPSNGNGNGHIPKARRTAAETAAAYAALIKKQPNLTQLQAANLLQISDRALREALKKAQEVTV
jgi:hypothetical protein